MEVRQVGRFWSQRELPSAPEGCRGPECENPRCRRQIQEDRYFIIGGRLLCRQCVEAAFAYPTEDYEGGVQ